MNSPRWTGAAGPCKQRLPRNEVIRLDPDNQRIGLSRKRLNANPWTDIENRYAVGQVIPVTITRLVDFGAFAHLEPGVEGLIHLSELADISVAEPLKTIRAGERVMAKILRIDSKRQRVGLSRRQAQDVQEEPDEETAEDVA